MGDQREERFCSAAFHEQVHVVRPRYCLDGMPPDNVGMSRRSFELLAKRLYRVGTRHVKLWRVGDQAQISPSKARFNQDLLSGTASPGPKALSGRNCLLGSMIDATFTCVTAVSDKKAILCTEMGYVCLLDDSDGQQKLGFTTQVDFPITSAVYDRDTGICWIGGRDSRIESLKVEGLQITEVGADHLLPFAHTSPRSNSKRCSVTALGAFPNLLVSVDSYHAIKIYNPDGEVPPAQLTAVKELQAHKEAVLGVTVLQAPGQLGAAFCTWSSGGAVAFWDVSGKSKGNFLVDLEQHPLSDDETPNELRILRTINDGQTFVSGDRYGVIR